MGRSFLSVRQGVNRIADRWERVVKKYPRGKGVVRIAKSYSSECFIGCNDPLEAVLFSAMVEIQKTLSVPEVQPDSAVSVERATARCEPGITS